MLHTTVQCTCYVLFSYVSYSHIYHTDSNVVLFSSQGFVVAGYILQALTRWNDIIQNGLRLFLNNLEHMIVVSNEAFRGEGLQEQHLRERVLRHSRLCLWVMFQNNGQNDGTLHDAVDSRLVEFESAEYKWLACVSLRMR